MIPVIANRSGGTAAAMGRSLRERIERAFADAGLAIDLSLVAGHDVEAAVRAAAGAPVVVVGGGDGTLGTAASVLAGSGSALGILPVGTRNHLARELGLPLDLEGAAQVIAAGATRRIDLGRANGRTFVNNASIGLYPSLVRFREAETRRRAVPKWVAAIPASYAALRRLRHHQLRLTMPDRAQEIETPMLFVGNNRYTLAPGRFGRREALDDGKLSVFALAWHGRRALLGQALATLIGRADPERDFAMLGDYERFRLSGRSRAVSIALDGEVMTMRLPIDFRIDRLALTVVAPLEGTRASH